MIAASNDKGNGLWKTKRVLAIAITCLVLLGLAGIGVTAAVIVQGRDFDSCQKRYNEGVARVLSERASAGDQDRMALVAIASSSVAMVDVLLRPEATVADRTQAVRNWRDAQDRAKGNLEAAEQIRKNSPLPAPVQC